jgi:Fe-S oxidoreductase
LSQDVLLWVDSFNNGFTPQVLEAGVEVLEKLGFNVLLMKKHICCGRPYYDVGMLDEAKRNLSGILSQLEPALVAKIPVIVLEPSCLSVFRDEMPGLFPDDERASQLRSSIMTLSEFIQNRGLPLPSLAKDVHIHGHCHQKACGGMGAEQSLLDKLGNGGRVLPTGCCGVAGAYAYHTKTAPVAQTIGMNEFKPHLDKLPEEADVVADGFSCRGQIKKVSGRDPIHLAQLLAKLMR